MKSFFTLAAVSIFSTAMVQAADNFDSLDYFNKYLTTDRYQGAEDIQDENRQTLEQLGTNYKNEYPRSASFISHETAEQILQGVIQHPVASLQAIRKYDPKGGIGFCFGRAMTVHLEALYRRISKSSIRKMWAVGDLRTGSMEWRYHVTSMIKGPGTSWYAIDPIFGTVMTAEDWYQRMQEYDHDGKMKIYITPASKFGPNAGKYAKGDLMDEFYNGYFNDLLKYYREHGAVSGGPLNSTTASK